ncbi:MAG: hypothetical protein R3C11_01840 [Planctomycetaceae bacterium]
MNDFILAPGHPIRCLYFMVQGELFIEVTQAFEELLISLASRRPWVIDAPQLVDYIDEFPDGSEVHTYGAALQMYSASEPWRKTLPPQIDRYHLEEVTLIVEELCKLSLELNCDFMLQYDDVYVGCIKNGITDESIRIGLLDEWQKMLDQSK